MITTADFGYIEQETNMLDKNSLVVFDADATLIVPDDAILKPRGKNLFKNLVASYTDRDLFRDIRMKAPHSLVDNRSISLIQKLQLRQVPVIILTAAPAKIRGSSPPGEWRVNEFKKIWLRF